MTDDRYDASADAGQGGRLEGRGPGAGRQLTDADLRARLWEHYRPRTRLRVYVGRLARGRVLLRQAAERGACAVFCSGGKDSLTLLHLATATLGPLPAYWIDSGAETPWTHDAIAAMRDRGYPIERLAPKISHIDILKLVGARGYDGPDRLPGDWHWRPEDVMEILIREPARRVTAAGYPVHLLGLRGEESRGRGWNRRTHGVLYQRQGEAGWTATPLADWEGADVLAYCLANDLPLSREYLDPRDDDRARERRRTGMMTGRTGVNRGRWRDLRRDHPALWQELVALFPAMADEA